MTAGSICAALALVLAQAPLVQPGAPGQPPRAITPAQSAALAHAERNAADIKFMQDMIGHHAQAVEMVELMKTRSTDPAMAKLGQRIAISQADEMNFMKGWLTAHDAPLPSPHAHHMHVMAGMLSPQQMAALAAAKGAAFDRLFLSGMIQHHQGALDMVADLMAQPGAGEESNLFEFTAGVVADQKAEIARMGAMLAAMPTP